MRRVGREQQNKRDAVERITYVSVGGGNACLRVGQKPFTLSQERRQLNRSKSVHIYDNLNALDKIVKGETILRT